MEPGIGASGLPPSVLAVFSPSTIAAGPGFSYSQPILTDGRFNFAQVMVKFVMNGAATSTDWVFEVSYDNVTYGVTYRLDEFFAIDDAANAYKAVIQEPRELRVLQKNSNQRMAPVLFLLSAPYCRIGVKTTGLGGTTTPEIYVSKVLL